MSMRVYIGHQVDAPQATFLVFAETKQEALDYLANEEIEASEASLTVVHEPGVVLFRARDGGRPAELEDLRYGGDLPDWNEAAEGERELDA